MFDINQLFLISLKLNEPHRGMREVKLTNHKAPLAIADTLMKRRQRFIQTRIDHIKKLPTKKQRQVALGQALTKLSTALILELPITKTKKLQAIKHQKQGYKLEETLQLATGYGKTVPKQLVQEMLTTALETLKIIDPKKDALLAEDIKEGRKPKEELEKELKRVQLSKSNDIAMTLDTHTLLVILGKEYLRSIIGGDLAEAYFSAWYNNPLWHELVYKNK